MSDYTLIQSGDADAAENVGALAGDTPREGIVDGLAITNFDTAAPSIDVDSGKTVHVLDTATAEWSDDDGNNYAEQRDQIQIVCHVDTRSGISLDDGSTVHVFVEPNWSTDDSPSIETNTTGSKPSPDAVKVHEVDTSADTTSEQWGLINNDGVLTYPDATSASTALSNYRTGTAVIDRANGTRIVDGKMSAEALEATTSITDPEGNTVTSLSNPVQVTEEASTFAESDITVSNDKTVITNGSIELDLIAGAKYDISKGTQKVSSTGLSNVGNSKGFTFTDSGFKLYVVDGSAPHEIIQYNLSTAYDVSSATYDSTISIDSTTDAPRGVDISNDGVHLLVSDIGDTTIEQFDLSTAYDLSTASRKTEISVTSDAADIEWGDNGNKFYSFSQDGQNIIEYTLGSSYDISSAVTKETTLDVSSLVENSLRGGTLKPDGTRLWAIDKEDRPTNIIQLDLGTAFDLSTADVANGNSTNLSEFNRNYGVGFDDDGDRLFSARDSATSIDRFSMNKEAESGDALVSFDSGSPADIDSWDLATFQRTLDGETVTVDIETVGFGTIQDFEDGDTSIDGFSWDSSYGGSTSNLTAQQNTVINGSWSGEFTSSSSSPSIAAFVSSGEISSSLKWKWQIDSDSGNTSDEVAMLVKDDSGTTIMYVEFQDGGEIRHGDGSGDIDAVQAGSWTTGEVYDVELIPDYSNNTFDLVVNGSTLSSDISFVAGASASGLAQYTIRNYTDQSGITRNVYLDDIRAGGALIPQSQDIAKDFDISNLSTSENVVLRANLSRNNTANNPTVDYLARRFTR